jgi:hypothetical protein
MNSLNIYVITFDLNTLSFESLKKVFFCDINKSIFLLSKNQFIREVTIIQKCNCCEVVFVSGETYAMVEDEIFKIWKSSSEVVTFPRTREVIIP